MESEPCIWIWIDLELTGLEVSKDKILEISVMLTDTRLEKIIEGPSFIIHEEPEILESMTDFVKKMHKKSGLDEQVLKSETSLEQATSGVIQFFQSNNVHEAVLAGNSVHMDRIFLMKHMPELFNGFISPFRLLDISTLKVLYMLYKAPNVPVKKTEKHRAIDDIKESIEELRFYMTSGFTSALLTK